MARDPIRKLYRGLTHAYRHANREYARSVARDARADVRREHDAEARAKAEDKVQARLQRTKASGYRAGLKARPKPTRSPRIAKLGAGGMSLETQLVVNYIKRQPPKDRERRLRDLVRDFPDDWLVLVEELIHEELQARNLNPLPPPPSIFISPLMF